MKNCRALLCAKCADLQVQTTPVHYRTSEPRRQGHHGRRRVRASEKSHHLSGLEAVAAASLCARLSAAGSTPQTSTCATSKSSLRMPEGERRASVSMGSPPSPPKHCGRQSAGLPNVWLGPVLPQVSVSSRYRPTSPSPPPIEIEVRDE